MTVGEGIEDNESESDWKEAEMGNTQLDYEAAFGFIDEDATDPTPLPHED